MKKMGRQTSNVRYMTFGGAAPQAPTLFAAKMPQRWGRLAEASEGGSASRPYLTI